MAEVSGVDKSTIHRIETGEMVDPPSSTVVALSEALDVSLMTLLRPARWHVMRIGDGAQIVEIWTCKL